GRVDAGGNRGAQREGRHPGRLDRPRRSAASRARRDGARAGRAIPRGQAAGEQHGVGAGSCARHHAARGAALPGGRRAPGGDGAAADAVPSRGARRPQPVPLPAPPARPEGERVVRLGPALGRPRVATVTSRPRGVPPEIVIDTRPLWRILVGRAYRPAVLLLGLAAFLTLRLIDPPAGLPPEGQKALAR